MPAGSSAATDERVEAALRHFGLEDLGEFPAAYLSAGQKRRLGLARLLVARSSGCGCSTSRPLSLDTASSERLVAAVNAHTKSGGHRRHRDASAIGARVAPDVAACCTKDSGVTSFWALVRRDLSSPCAKAAPSARRSGFFLVVVSLMPLGLGPDLNLLGAHRRRHLMDRTAACSAAVARPHFRDGLRGRDARCARDRPIAAGAWLLRQNRSRTG